MFSGTNLLTSCNSARCLFSTVFGFRNAENQYYRNWTGQKPKSIFYQKENIVRRAAVTTLVLLTSNRKCLCIFYTLSGTNLLTRFHSASCLFSSVFGSRKGTKSIFSELDRTKAKVNILPWGTLSQKTRWRGTPRWPHRRWERAHPGCAHRGVGPPALHRPCLLHL